MKIFLVFCCGLHFVWAGAEIIELSHSSQFTPDYSARAAGLKPGDTVVLNGRSFVLQRFRGAGEMAYVWDLGQGRAVRLLKKHFPIPCEYAFAMETGFPNPQFTYDLYTVFARRYVEGYRQLAALGVPSVRVFEEESHAPFYTVVESLPDPVFTLKDWARRGDFDHPELRPAWDAFWADLTSKVDDIHDFKPDAVAYVAGRGWILIDFASPVVPKGGYSQNRLLSNLRLEERRMLRPLLGP